MKILIEIPSDTPVRRVWEFANTIGCWLHCETVGEELRIRLRRNREQGSSVDSDLVSDVPRRVGGLR